jgi:hypothetical protein
MNLRDGMRDQYPRRIMLHGRGSFGHGCVYARNAMHPCIF